MVHFNEYDSQRHNTTESKTHFLYVLLPSFMLQFHVNNKMEITHLLI